MLRFVLFAAVFLAPATLLAGEADVVDAEARPSGGDWSFSVSVRHADTGWEHYADSWRVVGPDGTVYGTRVLAHPHVNEQPFTRSLGGVIIPEEIQKVTIEAHDSAHEWGGAEIDVALPR